MAFKGTIAPLLLRMTAMAGVLALAGCGTKEAPGSVLTCPEVAILADASKMTQYRDGPGRDLTDIQFDSELVDVGGNCELERKRNRIIVNAKLYIVSDRGAAARTPSTDVTYFVAVTDNQEHILNRQEFTTTVTFPSNSSRVAVSDELQQVLFLKKDQGGDSYRVLIGFVVSKEQLERNRSGR